MAGRRGRGIPKLSASGEQPDEGQSSARRHSAIDPVIHAGQPLPTIRREQRDDLRDIVGGAEKMNDRFLTRIA
jgi:hypothetical protein